MPSNPSYTLHANGESSALLRLKVLRHHHAPSDSYSTLETPGGVAPLLLLLLLLSLHLSQRPHHHAATTAPCHHLASGEDLPSCSSGPSTTHPPAGAAEALAHPPAGILIVCGGYLPRARDAILALRLFTHERGVNSKDSARLMNE